MHGWGARGSDPDLRQIVAEASRALARLDADRLEELARACESLIRMRMDQAEMVRQARDAAGEMAVLGRVLDATRANLSVMNRLRELRQGRIGYADAGAPPVRGALTGANHGDN